MTDFFYAEKQEETNMKSEDFSKQPFIIQKCRLVGVIRNLDSLGRVVIPSEFREMLGMREKQDVEIFLTNDGVLVRPVQVLDEKPKD